MKSKKAWIVDPRILLLILILVLIGLYIKSHYS